MKKVFYPAILTAALAIGAVSQTHLNMQSKPGAASVVSKGLSPATTAAKGFFNEINLSGVHNDAADCSAVIGNCRLKTIILRGQGEAFSVVLTLSLDHAATDEKRGGNNPAQGTWVMVVSRADVYIGTLFGDVRNGKVRWAIDLFTGTQMGRSTSGGLRILGGMDGYKEVTANDEATFSFSSFTKSALDTREYTEARIIKGNMNND